MYDKVFIISGIQRAFIGIVMVVDTWALITDLFSPMKAKQIYWFHCIYIYGGWLVKAPCANKANQGHGFNHHKSQFPLLCSHGHSLYPKTLAKGYMED